MAAVRVEIRVDDRIRYAHVVESVELVRHGGRLTLTAVEEGSGDAVEGLSGTVVDGVIPVSLSFAGVADALVSEVGEDGPPPPSAGAPDGDDESAEPTDQVIERVHTGDREPPKVARRGRTRKPAETSDGADDDDDGEAAGE